MPHGLHVDCDGNLWLTDVMANRVAQLTPMGDVLKELDGNPRFAKPADVTTDPRCTKVFVADGYENARVAVYDFITGEFLYEFGTHGRGPKQFNVVHGIAVDDNDLIYVADRENFRAQVFPPDGTFLMQWKDAKPTKKTCPGSPFCQHFSAIEFDSKLSLLWSVESGALVARTKTGQVVS